VGVLEIDPKKSKKKQFLKWWSVERKIELSVCAVMLVFLIVFWRSLLVEGMCGIFVAAWCFGKIYFRKDQWALLSLGGILALCQGLSALFKHLI
jgi:hypothetical protein